MIKIAKTVSIKKHSLIQLLNEDKVLNLIQNVQLPVVLLKLCTKSFLIIKEGLLQISLKL